MGEDFQNVLFKKSYCNTKLNIYLATIADMQQLYY